MGLFNLNGIVCNGYSILEAKLNNEIIYSPSKKYVEYTVDGADEFTDDYPHYVFPYINGYYVSDAVAEIHTRNKIYFFNMRELYNFSIYALDIELIKIWYPDNITSIDFTRTSWVHKITYIYTDDTITTQLPSRLLD